MHYSINIKVGGINRKMIKKLISLMCCCLPFGAWAYTANPTDTTFDFNPGTGNAVTGIDSLRINSGEDESLKIESGNGLIIGGVDSDGYGLYVYGNTYVGKDSAGGLNDLYAESRTDENFTIKSAGNIFIGNNLDIATKRTLTISNNDAGLINVLIGQNETDTDTDTVIRTNIESDAKLVIKDGIKELKIGAITSNGDFDFVAWKISTGAISLYEGGNASIVANGGDLTIEQFISKGNSVYLSSVGDITTSAIQQGGEGKEFIIQANGNLETKKNEVSSGNIENSGELMDIIANNINVSGSIKNDNATGAGMKLTVGGDLTVDYSTINVGGQTKQVSVVNTGNFNAVVAGDVTLAKGFDITTMEENGNFSLTANNLNLGTQNSLVVDKGTVQLKTKTGGMRFYDGIDNRAVTELISAGDFVVSAAAINNTGVLNIIGGNDITAGNNIITTGNNARTNISASNNLMVGGEITNGDGNNATQMFLVGKTVVLNSAITNNENAELYITASTDVGGKVTIKDTITNKGMIKIDGRQLEINKVLSNKSGVMNISVSDNDDQAVKLSGLAIDGGVVNLSALNGGIASDGTVNVGGNGALNFVGTTHLFEVDTIDITGNLTVSNTAATGDGNVNVAASGANGIILKSDTKINIGGNVVADADDVARRATFDAKEISIGGNVLAKNKGILVFGNSTDEQLLSVTGNITTTNGGKIELYTAQTNIDSNYKDALIIDNGGVLYAHGKEISTIGNIKIAGGLSLRSGTLANTGLVVNDGNADLTLNATDKSYIEITDGVDIATSNSLHLNSFWHISVDGDINNAGSFDIKSTNEIVEVENIASTGIFNINAYKNVETGNIENSGNMELVAKNGDVRLGGNVQNSGILNVNVQNSGDLDPNYKPVVNVYGSITAMDGALNILNENGTSINILEDVSLTGGTAVLSAPLITAMSIKSSATDVKLNTEKIDVSSGLTLTGGYFTTTATDISAMILSVSGNIAHNDTDINPEMLKLVANNIDVSVDGLFVEGTIFATKNKANYDVTVTARVGGITVANGAEMQLTAMNLYLGDIENSGELLLDADDGMELGKISLLSGDLTLATSTGTVITAETFDITGGVLHLENDFTVNGAIATTGTLYQNAATFTDGDIDITAQNYTLSASTMEFASIKQNSGALTLKTTNLNVNGDIDVSDLLISGNRLTMDVTGDVSNGVRIDGLQQMDVGGNYWFDNTSMLNVNVMSDIGRNYLATVSLNEDDTLGNITNNATDAQAMIQVGGKFVSTITALGDETAGGALQNGQIGIVLTDIVDPGTAIWLVHADNGLLEDGDSLKIRNLYVSFCNEDGSKCFNYLPVTDSLNGSDDGTLPVYLSVRDVDNDGQQDSLYIVFDERFGGPVQVFKIQPIVGRTQNHTTGEYISAGALDNLVADVLYDAGFKKRTPIESLPIVFAETNLETLMEQLYERMEDYNTYREGDALSRFSRLVQPREIDQIVSGVALNYHTLARDIEDHMFDEFIWNRNRKLGKAWFDADFGMYYNKDIDGRHIDGNRFSITGGYDWQESKTLIYGLFGHISHMAGADADDIDLSYQAYAKPIDGHIEVNVKNTDIAFGGYMIQTLAPWVRAYGQAAIDVDLLNISKQQTYIDGNISGDGIGLGFSTEWGILHDWLNQYIVGNAYVRMGYNFGTTITEQASGSDYMDIKLDGYFMLTPGYSLTAQKRIYPSMWFQIRPYASIGVEYDVLGTPDAVDYKFAMANKYTEYGSTVDPLWANIGGGVEFLGAFGGQIGLDYRYQYNDTIQLHNIKVSGKYRF